MLSHFHKWAMMQTDGYQWHMPTDPIPDLGGPGVALFFMITGLVFYPRVLKGFAETNWKAMYVSRFFRLVPLIAASTACVLLILGLQYDRVPTSADVVPVAIWISSISEPPLMGIDDAWMVNAGVLWTLRMEWLFYLFVLPIASATIAFASFRGVKSWIVLLAATNSILLAIPIMKIVGGQLAFYGPMLLLFALGMLAHEVQNRPSLKKLFVGNWAGLAAIASFVGGILMWQPWGQMSIPAVFLLAFFFNCVASGNSIFGLLRTKGALVLGECSFSIYIFHAIILYVFFQAFPTQAYATSYWIVPLAIVTTLFSAVTYLLIERPSMNLGRALAKLTGPGNQSRPIEEIKVAP